MSSETSRDQGLSASSRGCLSRAVPAGLVLCLGILLIAAGAAVEVFHMAATPVTMGMLLAVEEADGPGEGGHCETSYPALALRLESGTRFQDSIPGLSEEDQEAMRILVRGELLVMLDMPGEELGELLVSGRPPKPGEPEVLAGYLARKEGFELDGLEFGVTGHLTRDAAGFVHCFVLPWDARFAPLFDREDAPSAVYCPRGQEELARRGLAPEAAGLTVLSGRSRTPRVTSVLVYAGLVLVAVGGAALYMGFLRRFRHTSNPLTGHILRDIATHPRLVLALHLVLYGAFFGMMVSGVLFPRANLKAVTFVAHMFRAGELSYVGDAYMAGDIGAAAWATFVNNYLVQTVGLSVLPSVVIPFIGVLKTMVNFAVAGFVMAPLWIGTAAGMTYHSLTMVLEFEGYVIACVGIVMWPVHIVKGIANKEVARGVLRGTMALVTALVVSGIALAMAALYEAVTLILIG